jgi:hypothetical protein
VIPRDALSQLLERRLPALMPQEGVNRLSDEISALESGWEEMDLTHGDDMGYSVSANCSRICGLAAQSDQGSVIRMYREKKPGQ